MVQIPEIRVPMSEISARMTAVIRVTGQCRWSIRHGLSMLILRLFAWVAPLNTRLELDLVEEDTDGQ